MRRQHPRCGTSFLDGRYARGDRFILGHQFDFMILNLVVPHRSDARSLPVFPTRSSVTRQKRIERIFN